MGNESKAKLRKGVLAASPRRLSLNLVNCSLGHKLFGNVFMAPSMSGVDFTIYTHTHTEYDMNFIISNADAVSLFFIFIFFFFW